MNAYYMGHDGILVWKETRGTEGSVISNNYGDPMDKEAGHIICI